MIPQGSPGAPGDPLHVLADPLLADQCGPPSSRERCWLHEGKMSEPIGFILYDDSCGFCRRWVPPLETVLRKRGFEIAPLQSKWVAERLHASPEDLLSDLRLLLADGSQLRGADVYRYLMRRIWWAWPLYVLCSAPLLRNIFDWGYLSFANNRYWFSRACRLPPAPGGGVDSADSTESRGG